MANNTHASGHLCTSTGFIKNENSFIIMQSRSLKLFKDAYAVSMSKSMVFIRRSVAFFMSLTLCIAVIQLRSMHLQFVCVFAWTLYCWRRISHSAPSCLSFTFRFWTDNENRNHKKADNDKTEDTQIMSDDEKKPKPSFYFRCSVCSAPSDQTLVVESRDDSCYFITWVMTMIGRNRCVFTFGRHLLHRIIMMCIVVSHSWRSSKSSLNSIIVIICIRLIHWRWNIPN